jgi:hypothetical protein
MTRKPSQDKSFLIPGHRVMDRRSFLGISRNNRRDGRFILKRLVENIICYYFHRFVSFPVTRSDLIDVNAKLLFTVRVFTNNLSNLGRYQHRVVFSSREIPIALVIFLLSYHLFSADKTMKR